MSFTLPKLDGYTPNESGNKIKAGEYDLAIKRILHKDAYGVGDSIIIEFEVLKTYAGPHEPGQTVSSFNALNKKEITGKNLAGIMVAALGLDWNNPAQKNQAEKEVLPQLTALYQAACEGNSSIMGALKPVRCVAQDRTSKPDPKGQTHDYVRLNFSPAAKTA
jgi:hypothetical protein